MTRFTKTIDWVQMFMDDKNSLLETMYDNMGADLKAGYDPNGMSITREKAEIEAYKKQFLDEVEALSYMEEDKAQRWAWRNLIERGAID